MAATLTIVNQHGQTLAAHRLGNTPLAIRAQDQVQYQLAGEGGLAPANVEAARAGNDLLVHIDGQQALRIEDYFLLDDTGLKNPLLGMNESGQYVAYGIAEAPSVLPVEHVLAEEVAVASTSGSAISPIAALATIGGVALTGAVIASSGKDSDKADNGTPNQPQTPFDPNQPALPPVDNGNITPPPSNGGDTTPPPSGGGNTNPPPPPQPPKPNGSIAIEGEAKVGQTLTAKITDADGVSGSPQYQWLADGQPIANATQSTYTLTAAEKGKAISVQATYTDGQNTPEKPSSAATAPVTDPVVPPSANNLPTGEVKISGIAEVGQTLTASHTLKDGDGLGQITYKWFANGAEVGQGDTYTIQAQDKGKTLTVKAEYTDGKGTQESVESAATAPVDDAYLLREDFSGYALGSDYSAQGGSFGPWQTVFHGNGHVKIVDHGNGNHALELTPAAIASDQSKTAATLVVGPETGSHFEYSGTFATHEQLRENDAPNAWETSWIVWGYRDPDHFYYFIPKADGWELGKRDPAYKGGLNGIGGQRLLATGSEPVFTPESLKHFIITQNGNTVRVSINGREIVTFEDNESPYLGGKIGIYTEDARISADDLALKHIAPDTLPQNAHDGQITLSGEAKVGGVLTATVVDGDNIPTDGIHYIWYADNARIAGANGATLAVTREHLGKHISVQAMYTDHGGTSEAPVSAATAAVVDSNTPDTTAPVLTISADKPFLTGKGESAQLTFKLSEPVQNFAANDIQVNNGRIDNFVQVDATTYTATYTGVGSGDIRVAAGAFSDLAFNQNAEASLRIPLSVPGKVSIGGLPQIGKALTATIEDANGVPDKVQYQWLADGKAITSATQSTYTVRSEDAGKTISVRVIYQDGENFSEDVTSDATAPVQGDNVHVFANIAELMAAPLKADDKALITDFNHVNDNIGIRYTIIDTLPDAAQGLLNRVAVPLANGKYALPQLDDYTLPVENGAVNTKAMLQVATTYLDAGDKLVWDGNGETPLYVPGTPKMVKTPSGKEAFAITCSAFINMVMAGWKFEDTTYATNQNTSSYGWGIDFQDKPQGDKDPYSANAQLKWMYWKDQVALYNGKSGGEENYRVGDILFFSKQDPEGAGTGGNFFMNVYHSAIYIGNGKVMHSAGTYHGNGVVIEDLANLKKDLTWIGRPHLGNSTITIEGEAKVGATLTAKAADADGLPADGITYQWYADNRPIDGATAQTYTLTDADKGKAVTVRAKFSDGTQYLEAPTSAATAPVIEDALPQNQAPTDITLSANGLPENQVGAVVGKLATVDPDAGDSHTYAVNDNRFEVDAQGNLKLKDGVKVEFAQEKTIALEITTTDKGGASYQETFTINVQDDPAYPAPNQRPTGEVRINGDVLEGQTLSASHTLQDPDGLGDITYIWKAGGQEVGRGATYVPKPADIGKTLTVTASYADGRDHAESVESSPSQPVAADNRPVLTLQSLEDSIPEGQQTAYNLHLSKALDAPIEVELRLVHIDTDRKDFLSDQPWSVTIEAGQTDLGVFLRPLRDSADESAESYRVEIAGFSSNVRLGADSSVTTRIEDNTDPAQAGTMPAPVDISAASGKLVFQPDKNAAKMRIYYTSPAGEDKFFDFGAWEGEWSDYSSFPPGSSFDPKTGRTEIPVSAFKTGSEIIAWAADNTYGEPYESLNSVRVNANGGISPAASAKPQGARLFAADKALIGEESLLDLDNLGSIQHGSEGQDTFVIDSECLLDSGCITAISGFNPGHGDLLQLESSIFTALDKGTLAETAFVVGGNAGNTEHRVIYNASTGELAYDPDGSGATASTVIARLDPALELEAQHIQVI